MEAADLENLVREKSQLVLALEALKSRKASNREIIELASEAASLEARVALEHLNHGEKRQAAINFISSASCLVDARRKHEARRLFERALALAGENEELAEWIKSELQKLPLQCTPGSIFQTVAPKIFDNVALRRPQVAAYDASLKHFARRNDHAIIQLPVGTGKTGVMCILPFRLSNGRVLVVAPNLEIVTNLEKNLNYGKSTSFLKKCGILNNGHGPSCAILDSEANLMDCDPSDIVVSNIQQLAAAGATKWLAKMAPDYFDMILIDEGHHNVAPSWKNAIAQFPKAKIVSFTATPLRSDGQKVEGTRIYRFPIKDAIKEGYIKDIASRRLEPIEMWFTYKGDKQHHTLAEVLKLREEDWFGKGVALAPECNKHIVDASIQCVQELRSNGKAKHQIIACACSIDHAKSIRSLYKERHLEADVLHSNLKEEEQNEIRRKLVNGALDVVVQVQMLSEGADYPQLSVAAIFRPYRHLVPYVQFVGRIMRVIKQNAPRDPDNRGYIVSHVGLNVDRWWEDLRQLDEDDQEFYEDIANGVREFEAISQSESVPRRRFKPDMQVLEETIKHYIQEHFLPEDARVVVDDLIESMRLRGLDIDSLGITREQLEQKLLNAGPQTEQRGELESVSVSPQLARQEARRRLDERVKSAAKQLLNSLSLSVAGYELPKACPGNATNNLTTAIVLLHKAVDEYIGVGRAERDLIPTDQLQKAHNDMDVIIDKLERDLRKKLKR